MPIRPCLVAGASAFAMLVLGTACHIEGKVKAGSDESRSDSNEAPMTVSAPASTTPAPVAAPALTAPPADACPVTCFEARGSQRVDLTAEEQTQLRSALEPVLSEMRSCTSADDWRRHGSPVINLRIAPDGTLSDLGVDPHHGQDGGCFDQAGHSANVSVALPGRKVVRCAERCLREPAIARGRRPRR